jgi:hypothetical protein
MKITSCVLLCVVDATLILLLGFIPANSALISSWEQPSQLVEIRTNCDGFNKSKFHTISSTGFFKVSVFGIQCEKDTLI